MKKITHVPIQRLVSKIDNDFNISESDWIPRVAAWTIDALSQMKLLPMTRKTRELEVSERIAQFPCTLNPKEIKVFDSNKCEINELNNKNTCNCSSSNTINEIAIIDDTNKTGVNFMQTAVIKNGNSNRNYILNGNQIELNFDTDKIYVESYEVATYYDEYYDCDIPYIYDNGLLLEALSWYVLYKYLSRGSSHQVYSLTSPNQILNPYIQWTTIRPKAIISVRNELANDSSGWNNFFYNYTFDPRN